MSESVMALPVCLVVIVVLAALLYAVGRNYIAALAGIAELRATTARILADTQTSTTRCASSGPFFTTPTSGSALLQKGRKNPPLNSH